MKNVALKIFLPATLAAFLAIGVVSVGKYTVSPPVAVANEAAALAEVQKTNPSAKSGQGYLVKIGRNKYSYIVEIE